MVSTELITTLKNLNRSDKFQIMQILISELAEQEIDLIRSDQDWILKSKIIYFFAAASIAAKTALFLLT